MKIKAPTQPIVVIAGASGFLGQYLSAYLTDRGFLVKKLVRRPPTPYIFNEIYWNPQTHHIETHALEGATAIINLSGASIAHRWGQKEKARILDSRLKSTHLLSDCIAKLNQKPKVFLSASAIGFYGDRAHEELNENSSPGTGFMADVCQKWEQATWEAQKNHVRVVCLRTGLVLGPGGGFLKQLHPSGIHICFGQHEQWISWIALEDWLRAVEFLIQTAGLEGPFNLVSPHPILIREFFTHLKQNSNAWVQIPVPAILIQFLLGQMGQELLLSSQRVYPQALLKTGFEFKHENLSKALKALLHKDPKPFMLTS